MIAWTPTSGTVQIRFIAEVHRLTRSVYLAKHPTDVYSMFSVVTFPLFVVGNAIGEQHNAFRIFAVDTRNSTYVQSEPFPTPDAAIAAAVFGDFDL